ncbi:MAG: luciferase [Pseudonocardiales bacterium]|nr:luciferase [Pseudonocardiales bacterium]
MVEVGILLSKVNPRAYGELTAHAEALGFESVWLGEHLVLPTDPQKSVLAADEHSLDPATPIWDLGTTMAWLAAKTTSIRLGTFVYLLGMRHPFVAARMIATLDTLSSGRLEVGVGAGWLESEFQAAGLGFDTRGARLDESIEVCRRLWSDPVIEHHGEYFDFSPVAFEPKPVQAPLPLLIGGESPAALRRTARVGSGWLGMDHTPDSARQQIGILRKLEAEVGRAGPSTITVVGTIDHQHRLDAWAEAGVDRVIVSPWNRTRDALSAIEKLAGEIF